MELIRYRDRNCEVDAYLHKRMNKLLVEIKNGDWRLYELSRAVVLIKQWKVKQLLLSNNKQGNILKEISHISFPSLKLLNLYDNSIESIEGLNRIWIPNVENVRLAQNGLSSLRDLRKANWQNLTELGIINNKISEGNCLSFLTSRNLKSIIIQWTNDQQQIHTIDFSARLPIHTHKLKCITIKTIGRIHRQKLYQCLKRKYHKLQIKHHEEER